MKICVAQTKPIKGDIQGNLEKHKKFIDLAVAGEANLIIFPELSLTSYEPALAKALAVHVNDARLDVLQKISDQQNMIIGVGAPVFAEGKIGIGMIIFQAKKPRQVYFKKYLHPDEEKFFVTASSTIEFLGDQNNMALSICYELSVPAHVDYADQCGAKIYLSSVAKTEAGIEKATPRLAEIAKRYGMTVLMSNYVGEFNGCVSGGRSSIWNNQCDLIAQLDDKNEGISIFDGKEVKSQILSLW